MHEMMPLRQHLWRYLKLFRVLNNPTLRSDFARQYQSSHYCVRNLSYQKSCHLAWSTSQQLLDFQSDQNTHFIKILRRNFSENRVNSSNLKSDVIDSNHDNDFDNEQVSPAGSTHENPLSVINDGKEVSETDLEESVSRAPTRHYYGEKYMSVLEQVLQETGHSDSESSAISISVHENPPSTQEITHKVDIPPLHSVSPIVNESKTLKNLVELGVDLSLYEKTEIIGKIIGMDFEKDVQPYIWFLFNAGIKKDLLGHVLCRNPYIFQHEVEHLKKRVEYLKSKRFSSHQITDMILREPKFLCMETKRIDVKLGYYQKELKLKGWELRAVVRLYPKLLREDPKKFRDNKTYMKAILEFTPEELRQMFLNFPRVFYADMDRVIVTRYDYLSKTMGIPNSMISHCAWVLTKNLHVLQNRHRFLVKKSRDQYDPTKENYVSLQDLMQVDKANFCREVAKASVKEFDVFQRLI